MDALHRWVGFVRYCLETFRSVAPGNINREKQEVYDDERIFYRHFKDPL